MCLWWTWAALALTVSCGFNTAQDGLRPESEATRQCHDWPGTSWSNGNHATLGTFLSTGEKAIDLTLNKPNGTPVVLSELLETAPVLLISGSATCPIYRDNVVMIRKLAQRYQGKLHTLVVYTVEAHPKPGNNAYHGKPKPKRTSDRPEATTWAQRAADAKDLNAGNAMVVVDDLNGDRSNPFWCTYGTCPNCGFLIGQDGTLHAVHEWLDGKTMVGSIDALLDL
jgi:hypothetical protein